MKKPISPKAALDRLESLCARSEQCTYDLRRKLTQWGIATDESNKIIESLAARHFVDDARFAASYVRDKYRFNYWGRAKIVAGLIAKRVDRQQIDNALDEIDPDEYALLAAAALKSKARSIKDVDTYEGRTRLFRAGIAKGYEASLVSKIIKETRTWD